MPALGHSRAIVKPGVLSSRCVCVDDEAIGEDSALGGADFMANCQVRQFSNASYNTKKKGQRVTASSVLVAFSYSADAAPLRAVRVGVDADLPEDVNKQSDVVVRCFRHVLVALGLTTSKNNTKVRFGRVSLLGTPGHNCGEVITMFKFVGTLSELQPLKNAHSELSWPRSISLLHLRA